jgi:hypothetical protein
MKAFSQSRPITDQKAIKFLTDPGNHRYLRSFMSTEATIGEVASRLDEPLQRVFRQVRRMVQLGLVQPSRLQTRSGRAIRYYRASSDRFFVPFLKDSFEEVLLTGNLNFERRFIAAIAAEWTRYAPSNGSWGTSYARGDDGRLRVRAPMQMQSEATAPLPPLVFTRYQTLHLHPEDAQGLFAELTSLMERYDARGRSGQQAFLLRVGMTPS